MHHLKFGYFRRFKNRKEEWAEGLLICIGCFIGRATHIRTSASVRSRLAMANGTPAFPSQQQQQMRSMTNSNSVKQQQVVGTAANSAHTATQLQQRAAAAAQVSLLCASEKHFYSV